MMISKRIAFRNRLGLKLLPVILVMVLAAAAAQGTVYASETDGYGAESSTQTGETYSAGVSSTGWQTAGGKTFYLKKDGSKATGLTKIEGSWYLFNEKGELKTGWQKIKSKKYYFDPEKGGARARGFTRVKKYTYYFKKNGQYKTGWLSLSGKKYYFRKNGRMAVEWTTIRGKKYYFDPDTGQMATGTVMIGEQEYRFQKNGAVIAQGFTSDGKYIDAGGQVLKKNTIKGLLKTALQPVGSTMYVWGGGWGSEDSGGDITARTIGVNPQWKKFFKQQNSSYNYEYTRYQTKDGLDCSGYVGWVIYNTFNTTSGNAGYVMLAQVMARTYASYGWGTYTPASSVKNFKAGDIMSLASGHVYIVVGQCSDGSVVLLHSSPKGVMITGTTTRSGNKNSKAIQLSNRYMKKYFPAWYAKYPENWRGASYLTSYSQMRWHINKKKSMLSDPEGYRRKSAAAILKDLFKDF